MQGLAKHLKEVHGVRAELVKALSTTEKERLHAGRHTRPGKENQHEHQGENING